jgi:hypothetical protein
MSLRTGASGGGGGWSQAHPSSIRLSLAHLPFERACAPQPSNPYNTGDAPASPSGYDQVSMMEEGNNDKINDLSSRVQRMKEVLRWLRAPHPAGGVVAVSYAHNLEWTWCHRTTM